MKKILFIILTSFILFSCEDVLIEKPNSLAVETFYNTPAEIESAIGAIYSPLRNINCMGGNYIVLLESYTDYQYGRGSWASNSNFQGFDGTNISRNADMWSYFYLSIRNANIVIKNAPLGKKLTPAEVAKYVGEAKFLRAISYFQLVRNWNGVPIRTENNMTDVEIKRNTAEEVYKLILEDLAFAEANLPEVASLSGKPMKWAVKTVLADVYFYLNRYAEARDKANEVIQSGKFSLVPVLVADDFNKIFGPDVVTTPEEIFYLKFSTLSGFLVPVFAHHPGSKLHGGGGFYGIYTDKVTNQVIKNWDQNDLRYGLWYSWNIGFGTNTLLSKKYIDPKATGSNDAANDLPLYRYTDVLLMYAEAVCRVGGAPTADAMEKLNMVHRRAYGKDPITPNASVDFKLIDYNKDSFIELVIKERGYETQWEGKRWLDLKRTGEVKARIKAATGKDVADKHLFWPIPVSELSYNKAINPSTDQNPGY